MRTIRTMVLGGVALATLAIAAAAPAHADWRYRHGPHGWVRFWGPAVVVGPPAYYAPPPVYYAPPPVYYAPPPVVYAPPVVVAPSFGIGIHIR
jgi:hypothetical protein